MSDNLAQQSQQAKPNPLSQWFRQPKIYVKLPSKGRFYPDGSLDVSTNEEYPVYAMTAKDELMFKTPDALLSGQSTVEIIKSCVPAIKDPWKMPSIDIDFVLMAIRIATYGEMMEVNSKCPHCNEDNTYEINVNNWIGSFANFEYNSVVSADPLTVHIRPYNYDEMTKASLKTLEQQKILSIVNDESLSDEEKVTQFGKSYVKLTELTVDIIADCITRIETPNGTSDDKAQIREFINNTSKDIFEAIQKRINDIKSNIELKAQSVVCSECSTEYTLPITIDQSNFFGVRS